MEFNEFIKKAKEVHGDKYDYSKTDSTFSKSKTIIKCPEHGEFEQTPYRHLRGQGCPKCGRIKANNKMRYNKNIFIEKARQVHGDKYDYSKVEYINSTTKVCIICPEHGEFWMYPPNHINQKQGCPKCSGRLLDLEIFIEKGRKKHGDKYDYSKVDFNTNKDKVTIICPEHGEFEQSVNDHLNGCGCQICGKITQINKRRKPQNEVISDFIKVHGDKYDYSKVEYINNHIPITIICPEHGEFEQTPCNHLNGNGCPKCNQSHGEDIIKKYLEKHHINFTQQKTFDWLKYKRKQKLDFYLDDFNIGIEFQGIQHYKPVFWKQYSQEMADMLFNDVVNYDTNKQMLCNKHGVKIFYIKYNDDIEKKLNEVIKKIAP